MTRLRWENMSVGDRLGPVHYVLTPEVAAEFAQASNLSPAAHALLAGDQGQPVAHPMLTQSDYMQLLQDRYGPMGTGLHTRQRTVVHRPLPPGIAEGLMSMRVQTSPVSCDAPFAIGVVLHRVRWRITSFA